MSQARGIFCIVGMAAFRVLHTTVAFLKGFPASV